MRRSPLVVLITLTALAALQTRAGAQSLNFEGQTGGVVTPFATVADSPSGAIGRPLVSFHLADSLVETGDVAGPRYQIAVAIGLAGRAEVGYTRSAVNASTLNGFGNPFDRGFSTLHGKLRFVDDSASMPAVAAGALFRWQGSDLQGGEPMRNADVCIVATKSFPAGESVTILVSGGAGMTNTSLLGIAGDASGWNARAFGAVAAGIGRRVTAGAEFLQQPGELELLPDVQVPATVTGFGRITVVPDRVSVVVALVRLVGLVLPDVNRSPLDLEPVTWLSLGATVRF
jgi:hypothetical protein